PGDYIRSTPIAADNARLELHQASGFEVSANEAVVGEFLVPVAPQLQTEHSQVAPTNGLADTAVERRQGCIDVRDCQCMRQVVLDVGLCGQDLGEQIFVNFS